MDNFISSQNTQIHEISMDILSQNIKPILNNTSNLSINNEKSSTITINTNNICKNKNKKKKKKNRCSNCNKCIGFLKLNCKCSDNIFCSACILSEVHNCTYDFKKDRYKLEKNLVRVCNEKIIKI